MGSPARPPRAPAILSAPRIVNDVRATLGEGLCWSEREQALFWVDILEHRLYREDVERGTRHAWSFDETISAVAERTTAPASEGGLMATLRRGLVRIDLATGAVVRFAEPEPERAANRFNDGKCDAAGRFWGCTMDFDATAPTGALYRFDADGRALRALDLGWPVTNGPAWSLDQRTLFVNDTVQRRVVVYAFDPATGDIGVAREWLVLPEGHHPDGMTTDAAGRLWIAHWGGACVTCHDPATGDELARIDLPTAHVTNVCFGGADLKTLYITTARFGLDAAQLAAQPQAGALFAVDVDAVGLPANRFGD